jgi:hypothetical protein
VVKFLEGMLMTRGIDVTLEDDLGVVLLLAGEGEGRGCYVLVGGVVGVGASDAFLLLPALLV